ncbi:hypothetical protein GCM10027284_09340 [Cyclobacterium sediminis]
MTTICKLCKLNTADKTGSHIVPHFLLKRIENIKGKTGRGYEIGFVINKANTKSYFGREVLPEKLEDVYGDLTEKELSENSHSLIIDNIFCSDCEKKLAVIEGRYSQTLPKTDDINYSSDINSGYGFLFWSSLIWRLSICGVAGMSLTHKQSEILRRILSETLKLDLNKIDLNQLKRIKFAKKISYKLFRSPGFSEEAPTYLHFYPNSKNPYSLLIWEYILFFSFNDNYNDFLHKKFFGIQNEIFSAPTNKLEDNEQIYFFANELMMKFHKNLIDFIKSLRSNHFSSVLDKLHIKMGGIGSKMPNYIKQEIINEITSDEKKIGRAYTSESLSSAVIKILNKYVKK